jgi:hypothetical protein
MPHQSLMHHGAVAAARAVYKHTLLHFPKKKSIWLKAAHLEKQSGTPEALDATLQEAVSNCPEVPWYPGPSEHRTLNSVLMRICVAPARSSPLLAPLVFV